MSRNGFDPTEAYRLMTRMRLVEEALVTAWHDGIVPGEYHSAIGEEGIVAGILMHLAGHDATLLDHRNTSPLIGRGVDPESLMLEVLGSERGMNRGMAGHMHLMAPEVHAGADGMVGSGGPLAVGHAIANTALHPGRIAVAFHGEATSNQGMLMESYNMAAAWKLPVLFVCKDNKWSISTYSKSVTGGDLVKRARGFGLAVETADGTKVDEVHAAAGRLIDRARAGKGPGYLHVTCHRPGGHFEGDPIVRLLKQPATQAKVWGPGIKDGALAASGTRSDRISGVAELGLRGARAARDWTLQGRKDPLRRGRRLVGAAVADRIEAAQRAEIGAAIANARAAIGPRRTFGVQPVGAR